MFKGPQGMSPAGNAAAASAAATSASTAAAVAVVSWYCSIKKNLNDHRGQIGL